MDTGIRRQSSFVSANRYRSFGACGTKIIFQSHQADCVLNLTIALIRHKTPIADRFNGGRYREWRPLYSAHLRNTALLINADLDCDLTVKFAVVQHVWWYKRRSLCH